MVITETQVGLRAYTNTLTKVSEPGEGFENGSSQYSINPTANHFSFSLPKTSIGRSTLTKKGKKTL